MNSPTCFTFETWETTGATTAPAFDFQTPSWITRINKKIKTQERFFIERLTHLFSKIKF